MRFISKLSGFFFFSLFLILGFAYQANAASTVTSTVTCNTATQIPDFFYIGPTNCTANIDGVFDSNINVLKYETRVTTDLAPGGKPTRFIEDGITKYCSALIVNGIDPCDWWNIYVNNNWKGAHFEESYSNFSAGPRTISFTLNSPVNGFDINIPPYKDGSFTFQYAANTQFRIYCTDGKTIINFNAGAGLSRTFRGLETLPIYKSFLSEPFQDYNHPGYFQCPGPNGVNGAPGSANLSLNPTTPSIPTSLTVTPAACSTGTINISWTASAGATSYSLRDGGTVIYTGTQTSFSHTGLAASSNHNYSVLATNASGSSAYSNAVSGTAPAGCLAANVAPVVTNVTISPKPVTADSVSKYNISVTANDSNGGSDVASQYAMINYDNVGYRRGYVGWSIHGFPWFSGGSPTSPSPSVSCAGGGTAGETPDSGSWGQDYINIVSCSTSVTGDSRTTTFVVTFNPLFKTNGPQTNNTVCSWAADMADLYDTWRCIDTFDLSSSNPTTPSIPTSLTVTPAACSTGTINISWTASAGATSYSLRDGGTVIYTGTQTSFSHTGLAASSNHNYSVLATNASGSSAYSNAVSGTAPAGCAPSQSSSSIPPTCIVSQDTIQSSLAYITTPIEPTSSVAVFRATLWDAIKILFRL